ncbi:MAG: sensor histidine kinase [Velocimicrobium sp.]
MKKNNRNYLSYRIFVSWILLNVFVVLLFVFLFFFSKYNEWRAIIILSLLLIYVFISYINYRLAIKPYRESNKIFQLFSEGYTIKGVFELRYPMSKEEEKMLAHFKEMLDTKELINVSKKQAEYLALQNQINPHFLYNTLEGIRSEALCAGIEGVAKMSEALSLFFRYTISNVENLVTLEDELKNVENYCIIQQFRFEDRLRVIVELDAENEQELLIAKMPKLMLQPIVENSIYHGLEEKLGQGIVKIRVRTTAERLTITISDNGLGIPEDTVDKLNKKLRSVELIQVEAEGRSGGIALANVNSRIQLLFGEEYGLYVYSTLHEGTQVEITLPYLIK